MKYVLVLFDGMADEPCEAIGGSTPMVYADTPNLDALSKTAQIGTVRTVPEGMPPGSDVANMSVLGFSPREYYTGRSPLEALSLGVLMNPEDIAFRCNLVTLSEDIPDYDKKIMLDYSSGEIDTADAYELLSAVKAELETDSFHFFPGLSYRHCLLWNANAGDNSSLSAFTPPHDISDRVIGEHLPSEQTFLSMMKKSYEILVNHPVNIRRKAEGHKPGNSIWLWGAGTKPALPDFFEKTGKKGCMISAVDLLKGLAAGAGMTNIEVEGATGLLDTNYRGKAEAAVKALTKDGFDFVYVHIEAADEMGHQGSLEKKIQAIEHIDKEIVGPITEGLRASGEPFVLMALPDHPTPVSIKTHTSAPVPFLIYNSKAGYDMNLEFSEKAAVTSPLVFEEGYRLMDFFLNQ